MVRRKPGNRNTELVAKTATPGPLVGLSQVDVLLLMTVKIVGRLQGDSFPRRCGFLRRQGELIRVFTAKHGIDDREWFLEIPAPKKPGFPDQPVQVHLHPIGPFFYFEHVRQPHHGVDSFADLAFADFDPAQVWQALAHRPDFKGLDLVGYAGALGHPAPGGSYAFAAFSKVAYAPSLGLMDRESVIEAGMSFDGIEPRTGLHRFIVRGEHRGEEYGGASGAPIVNEAGVVVSIVKGGDPDKKVIWGFPLTDFIAALDRGPDSGS